MFFYGGILLLGGMVNNIEITVLLVRAMAGNDPKRVLDEINLH